MWNGFGLQTNTDFLTHPAISGVGGRQDMMTFLDKDASTSSSKGRVRRRGRPFKGKSSMEIPEPRMLDFSINTYSGGNMYPQLNEELPIQFADFFLLSVGVIDGRASYHNNNQIIPVGYRSCYHDRLTGSLFMCDVLEGGDSGPIFKITRYSCSQSPIPTPTTVLSRRIEELDTRDKVEIRNRSDVCFELDDDIQRYLSDPNPPDQDIFSIAGIGSNGTFVQKQVGLPLQVNSQLEKSSKFISGNSCLGVEIGEFFAEGRSLSVVWAKMSESIRDKCHEIFGHSGSLQFYCKHQLDVTCNCNILLYPEALIGTKVDSLAKLCGSCGPKSIPSVISSHYELETACKELTKWFNQDRFGLDMDFVQEVIEKLPGTRACAMYENIDKRRNVSVLHTVGSGYLSTKRKNYLHSNGYGSDVWSQERKRSRYEEIVGRCPPQGKSFCTKIPEEMVGDVIQIWEFLWRFYELLGMSEPPSLEELQKELVDPWFNGPTPLEIIEKKIEESRKLTSDEIAGGTVGQAVSSHSESGLTYPGENPPNFIIVETGSWKESYETRLASRTYNRCTGVALTKAHSSLLKVLVGELQAKAAAVVDPTFDLGESKSKRGRKKDIDNTIAEKVSRVNILPINALTWPELARRYILAISFMDGNFDLSDISSREGVKVIRCLHGDGGVLCGSLTGLTGMEADAVLLAEATKQVRGPLKMDSKISPVEYKVSEAVEASELTSSGSGDIPEWAKLLEPVRKLPTNVGTRIRNCVKDALNKDPPEWAREILEYSISKEIYKGNASGPTKKAVISVLSKVCGEGSKKPNRGRKAEKTVRTLSDVIMKQCRCVLRFSAAADEAKVFCNLLATTPLNPNNNEDEGILGSPAMVSRPLDFRTVDLRLAVGAYGGSHDAFFEDVREVWHDIQTAYADRPELMQLAETLSKSFESSYEKEVLTLVQACREYANNPEGLKKELEDVLVHAKGIPKAPWDDGVCKVCGVDKDDESVLLCDTCDSEYHTYCLHPPLPRIPEGNWFCPSCVAGQTNNKKDTSRYHWIDKPSRRKRHSRQFSEGLNRLTVTMGEKEYWEFNLEERILLLKFLCDEVLNSAIIREHLDKCANTSVDLQEKLRSLTMDYKNLKDQEDTRVRAINDPFRSNPEYISEKYCNGIRTKARKPSGAKDVYPVMDDRLIQTLHSDMVSLNIDDSNRENMQHLSVTLQNVVEYSSGEHNQWLNLNGVNANFCGSNISNQQSYISQANFVKNDVLLLRDSIASLESQLLKVSLRRNLLGRDSSGRLYWTFGRRGKSPCFVVDESKTPSVGMCPTAGGSCSTILYESDIEIQGLINWFRDSDETERTLKDLILRAVSLMSLDSQQAENGTNYEKSDPLISLATKAVIILEKKYGPCVEPETNEIPKKRGRKVKVTEEDRMYRCECLELVWPSRQHCLTCHQTFCIILEYERHYEGRCSSKAVISNDNKDDDDPLEMDKIESKSEKFEVMSRLMKFKTKEEVCPYNLEEISQTFITNDSNRELVGQFGLIGSNGIPSFIPTMSPYLHDPTLSLHQNENTQTRVTVTNHDVANGNNNSNYFPKSLILSGTGEEIIKVAVPSANDRNPLSSPNRSQELDDCCIIPQSSLKPLVGKVSNVLRLLKINLLDMDAALPEVALRKAKADWSSRCAWRAFVKSADSILEMIKAVVVFEDMIKTEYLRNGWWYWSSLSAAARTSTVSSLSLRIYALDSAIAYEKPLVVQYANPPSPPRDDPRLFSTRMEMEE